jgi:hypothetical protein
MTFFQGEDNKERPDFGDPAKKERYLCNVPGCKEYIIFGERDQEFYIQNGWVDEAGNINKPKKCKMHRAEAKKRKQERELQNG